MKKIKILVLVISMSFFVSCGGSGSNNSSTKTTTVDVREYMYDKFYTADNEGNITHESYKNDYHIRIEHGSMNWSFKSNGDVWFYDSRIGDLGRTSSISFPNDFPLNKTYKPENEDYDIFMARENDNLAIVIRLYNGTEVLVDAEYYFNKGNGLYKTKFNGDIIID